MEKFRVALICPAEIAVRRFLPALNKVDNFIFSGVGVCSDDERFLNDSYSEEERKKRRSNSLVKAQKIVEKYGGQVWKSYNEVIESEDVDGVYIPLPPALHFEWTKRALLNKKHVLVEKPMAISYDETKELLDLASSYELAIQENYMFVFHKQIQEIRNIVNNGEIGSIRLIRMDFGFPKRSENDFRYNKNMGGGALLDAGGYVIKLASQILGNTAEIVEASMNYEEGYEVDLYGSGVMKNFEGNTVQFSYGMDNEYRCSIDIWGSRGTINTNRIFTAPDGYIPELKLVKKGEQYDYSLSTDDSFYNSLIHWRSLIYNRSMRITERKTILVQSLNVNKFIDIAGRNSV